jgi:hypothetical protein
MVWMGSVVAWEKVSKETMEIVEYDWCQEYGENLVVMSSVR